MNIILTNDDGYQTEGIQVLYKLLQDYGNVYLVAPHSHMSGASVSRIFWSTMRVHKHDDRIYSVEGTPADSVALALFGLNIKADLVVSGINDGPNLGADTVYSGTVGACMEALKYQVPAIAFSADTNHLRQAKKDLRKTLDFIFQHDLISKKYLLNVNFVSRRFASSKGILITDLGFRNTKHFYVEQDDHFVAKRQFVDEIFDEDTDLYAFNHGYISITPLKYANQSQRALNEVRKKVMSVVKE
jgi:5'-nucleotidase